MSPHAQFWLLTLASAVATAPVMALAWRRHTTDRVLALWYCCLGYGLIIATLIVDSFTNPPLIFHGFFPGIGCGLIALALALALSRSRAERGAKPK
jgi:hypothetical protein